MARGGSIVLEGPWSTCSMKARAFLVVPGSALTAGAPARGAWTTIRFASVSGLLILSAVALTRGEGPADKKVDGAGALDDPVSCGRPLGMEHECKGTKRRADRHSTEVRAGQVQLPALRRMDTGEVLILPLTPAELQTGKLPKPAEGHWWNGTNKDDFKGTNSASFRRGEISSRGLGARSPSCTTGGTASPAQASATDTA